MTLAMKHKFLILSAFMSVILAGVFFTGCKYDIKYTTISIEDSIRRYTPIRRGQALRMVYKLKNEGEYPLIIKDIQPSCGCISADKGDEIIVPPEQQMVLEFEFDSSKNTGYVSHTIRLFGNIMPEGEAIIKFYTNVVAEAKYLYDYEDLYRMENPVMKGYHNYSTDPDVDPYE